MSSCLIIFNISFNESIVGLLFVLIKVILQDFLSGEILYEKQADDSIYPASMTKIMTSIIAFDLIKSYAKRKLAHYKRTLTHSLISTQSAILQ